MPQNLFAACRTENGLIAKRVKLDATVQQLVEDIFESQESDFRRDVTEEVAFDGRWKPDAEEFLTIDIPEEASFFQNTLQVNALAVPDIGTSHFMEEGIKALFTGNTENGATKVLVQRFTAHQVLSKQRSFLLQGNAFRQLTETAFSLDSKLTCIIEDGKIKFKKMYDLRSIINLVDLYREATNQEVIDFAGHASLSMVDVNRFVGSTNQTCRKLIHSVSESHVLDLYTPQEIHTAAQQTNLLINIQNGRIAVPVDSKSVKELLQFLNESRYTGPLSHKVFVTNSQRLANGTN